MRVNIKLLSETAKMPFYATPGAAAMDLYAAEDAIIKYGQVTIVSTDIALELPPGYEAQIRSRSSMAAKGIIVVNAPGTIDNDYRGKIKIIMSSVVKHELVLPKDADILEEMYNARYWPQEGFKVFKGDRIAQMVIAPVTLAELVVVTELSSTERGEGGLGHTGTR